MQVQKVVAFFAFVIALHPQSSFAELPPRPDFDLAPEEALTVHGVIGAVYYEEPLQLNCTVATAKLPNPPSRDMVHYAIGKYNAVKSVTELRNEIQLDIERMERSERARTMWRGLVLAYSALDNVEAVWAACRKSQAAATGRLNGPEIPVSVGAPR